MTKVNWHCVASRFSQSAAGTSTCGHVVKLQQLGSTHGVTRTRGALTFTATACGMATPSSGAPLAAADRQHDSRHGQQCAPIVHVAWAVLHEYSARFDLWGQVCTAAEMIAVPVYAPVPCEFHTASQPHVPGFTAAPRMPGKSWSHTFSVASDGVPSRCPAPLAQPRHRGPRPGPWA